MKQIAVSLTFGLLLLLVGCGRQGVLNVEKDVEIENQGIWSMSISPPNQTQQVSVLVRTAGGPLDVYLIAESEWPKFEKQLEDQVAITAKSLAKKEKVKEGQVDATISAGQAFRVVVANSGKSSKVSIKIVGSTKI